MTIENGDRTATSLTLFMRLRRTVLPSTSLSPLPFSSPSPSLSHRRHSRAPPRCGSFPDGDLLRRACAHRLPVPMPHSLPVLTTTDPATTKADLADRALSKADLADQALTKADVANLAPAMADPSR